MSRRRYVVIGMTLVALLVLAACGADAAATPGPTPTDVPPATLVPTSTPEPVATSTPLPASTSVPAASSPELRPLTAEALDRFAANIEEIRQSFNVPGMAVVVVQGGEVAFAQGFGI